MFVSALRLPAITARQEGLVGDDGLAHKHEGLFVNTRIAPEVWVPAVPRIVPAVVHTDARHIYHVPAYNMVYCQIQKVASTTLKSVIYRLFHPNTEISQAGRQNPHIKLKEAIDAEADVLSATTYSTPELTAILNSPALLRFAVVREPLDRFVSGFLDKCVKQRPTVVCPVSVSVGSPVTVAQLADAVLKALEAASPPTINEHFLPQHYFCGLYSHHSLYRIFRYEDMLPSLIAVGADLDVSEKQRATWLAAVNEFVAVNDSPHKSRRDDLDSWLTPARVTRIQRFYAADYGFLGYPIGQTAWDARRGNATTATATTHSGTGASGVVNAG